MVTPEYNTEVVLEEKDEKRNGAGKKGLKHGGSPL